MEILTLETLFSCPHSRNLSQNLLVQSMDLGELGERPEVIASTATEERLPLQPAGPPMDLGDEALVDMPTG